MNNTKTNEVVILPCYNEEKCIGKVLEELSQINPSLGIIVVNDGSTDKTAEIVSKTSTATLIDLAVNLGVGGAMQVGFKHARDIKAAIAVKFDGDGQHPPSSIERLLFPIKAGQADVIIGSRFLEENAGFQSSFLRKAGICFFQHLCYLLTGQKITDPTSGFRAYSRRAIELFANDYPDFDYPEPEEIIFAMKNDLKVIEIPTEMRPRIAGVSTISNSISIYYMCKVTLAMLFIFLRPAKRSAE